MVPKVLVRERLHAGSFPLYLTVYVVGFPGPIEFIALSLDEGIFRENIGSIVASSKQREQLLPFD